MCNPVSTHRPDDLLDKGVHLGYEWEVVHNRRGYRCGYVRIPPGHPWHGKHYSEIDPEVHGGLTFAEADITCGKGGDDDAWWLGFDCAHAGDAADPELPGYKQDYFASDIFLGPDGHGTVRTTGYAAAECQRLAAQAADAAGS